MNIKNQDSITKILDMVPDFVNKFAGRSAEKEKRSVDVAAQEAAAQDLAQKLNIPAEEAEEEA